MDYENMTKARLIDIISNKNDIIVKTNSCLARHIIENKKLKTAVKSVLKTLTDLKAKKGV